MTLVQNIKTFIKSHSIQGTKATWILFVLFALILFLKNVLFNWFAFHSILVSSLWKQPLAFFLFYLSKGAIALFVSSFVFITKRKWWVIVLSFILDIWIIANLVYYGANDFFIDFNTMFVANNLSGFGDSIFTFFSWTYLIFPFLTVLLWLVLSFVPATKSRKLKPFIYTMIIYVFCYLITCVPDWKRIYYNNRNIYDEMTCADQLIGEEGTFYGVKHFIPFRSVKRATTLSPQKNQQLLSEITTFADWSYVYTNNENIIQYLPAMLLYNYYYQQQMTLGAHEIDNTLKNTLHITAANKDIHPNNLIIILVESFESWILAQDTMCGEAIMPNLKSFMHTHPTIYCSSIVSQVKAGVSGDGQLIIHTGLLPVNQGVVTQSYSDRTFPCFVHTYPHSSTVTTCLNWNQDTMSMRYGYKAVDMPYLKSGSLMDLHLFQCLDSTLKSIKEPFAIQAITTASHSPFRGHNNQNQFPNDMPIYMKDYLCCLNYTDSCMKLFFDEFEKNPKYQNSTIVITGDHTVFKSKILRTFKSYAAEHNIPINGEQSYCPLIIYSPKIKENVYIDEICYQMDIYPTILNLVGCEGYYWKGFGVNLLDSAARNNRPFTPEQAYQLSDKLIRADYFRELQ